MFLLQARHFRLHSVLVGGLALAAAAVLFWFDPSYHAFYPICVFHRTTGLLCPGCGSLRALHQLLHGHFAIAFRFNPLLILSLPFLVWFGITRTPRERKLRSVEVGFRPFWVWIFLALALVFSVMRNLPGPFFSLMRP